MSKNAMDWNPCSLAKDMALRTESRMELSEEHHCMLIPAT
ncbi:MAG: hypothetical protein ACI9F9_002674 [Candidatus Paceibacteria bacterium]|jgi:hypothetical protein